MLYIVEPFLRDLTTSGHAYQCTHNIVQAAATVGLKALVFASAHADPGVMRALPAVPALDPNYYFSRRKGLYRFTRVGPRLELLYHSLRVYSQLHRHVTPHLWGNRDALVLFTTFLPRMTPGFAWWFSQVQRFSRARFMLLLHDGAAFRPSLQGFFAGMERAAAGRLALGMYSARVFAALTAYTQLPRFVLPMPNRYGADDAPPFDLPGVNGRRLFMWLGQPRDDKGFALLAQAIDNLNQSGAGERLGFVVQAYSATHLWADQTRAQLQALERRAYPNVWLIREVLADAGYLALVRRADGILMPYMQHLYQQRSSGVYADATAEGKPVIATEDTWMSDQIARYHNGLTVRDNDPADLTHAILTLDRQYADYAARAERARQEWRASHNADRFIAEVLRAMSG